MDRKRRVRMRTLRREVWELKRCVFDDMQGLSNSGPAGTPARAQCCHIGGSGRGVRVPFVRMRPIPPKLREYIASLPRMTSCERREGTCTGRITWEHTFMYQGRQINEPWAIIALCEYHHLGPGLDKEKNHWISLGYATEEDLKKYPRVDWEQMRKYLNKKYGVRKIRA